MSKQSNILFITTDQQRKDTLGCYGNPIIKTPNLDRLAEQGVIFDRAYCESPICLPSRVTMITGKASSHHGVLLHNTSMRDDEITLGDVLGANGYCTHFIGKPHFKSQQHRGTEESIADWKDGKFEDWYGPYAGFQTVEMILGHSNCLGGHYGKWLRENHADQLDKFKAENFHSIDVKSGQGTYRCDIPEELYSSTYVGDKTCAFLDEMQESDKPFYCFASFPDPHWPINPPKPYFSMYDDVDIPPNTPYDGEAEKDNYPQVFKTARNGEKTFYCGGGHYLRGEGDDLKITRAYWGSVSLIDKNVGRILDKLEELGLTENTIVVFTTDHGEYMGAHGLMAKGGFLWEEYINTPFILRYPEVVSGGKRIETLLSFLDIVPTLLDMAGIKDHGMACDGVSQLPVLTGKAESARDSLFVIHPNSGFPQTGPDQYALIKDEWKLVYFAGDKNGLLFNLHEDPEELNNLYNRPESVQIQTRMIQSLLDEIILCNDKAAVMRTKNADHHGVHLMIKDHWAKAFEAVIPAAANSK